VTSAAKSDHARSSSCSIGIKVPGRCPFGGACHTCPSRVQARLRVGEPDDFFEREAERVAEQVTRDPVVGSRELDGLVRSRARSEGGENVISPEPIDSPTRCGQDIQPSAWKVVNSRSDRRAEQNRKRSVLRGARGMDPEAPSATALGSGSRSDNESRAGLPAVTVRALRKRRSTCGSVPLDRSTLESISCQPNALSGLMQHPRSAFQRSEGLRPTSGPTIQRSCSDCSRTGRQEDEDEELTAQLERAPGSATKQEPMGELPKGSEVGSPLPPGLREDFELRFGRDFSRVRIHTGAEAGVGAFIECLGVYRRIESVRKR